MSKPTAASRLQRSSPSEQPPASPSDEVRVKPVRLTVDLDPADHEAVREFAFKHRMSHSDVVRSLISLLSVPDVAKRVSPGGQLPI